MIYEDTCIKYKCFIRECAKMYLKTPFSMNLITQKLQAQDKRQKWNEKSHLCKLGNVKSVDTLNRTIRDFLQVSHLNSTKKTLTTAKKNK